MIRLYYRMKNEKGDYENYSSESTWKSTSDFFAKMAKNPEFCDWVENTNVCFYLKEEDSAPQRKCPV